MKKVLYLTFCIIIVFLCSNTVSADECSSDEIARLKGVAAGVSYDAEFIGDSDDASDVQNYRLTFTGITDEIYVSDSHYSFFVKDSNRRVILTSGVKYFEIYSRNCNNVRLKTITVDLPRFNEYSLSDYCDDDTYKVLDVCDPWYTGKLTDEEFNRVIEEYNKKHDKDEISFGDMIQNFVYDNLFVFIGMSVVLIIIIIIVIVFHYKNNKLD